MKLFLFKNICKSMSFWIYSFFYIRKMFIENIYWFYILFYNYLFYLFIYFMWVLKTNISSIIDLFPLFHIPRSSCWKLSLCMCYFIDSSTVQIKNKICENNEEINCYRQKIFTYNNKNTKTPRIIPIPIFAGR